MKQGLVMEPRLASNLVLCLPWALVLRLQAWARAYSLHISGIQIPRPPPSTPACHFSSAMWDNLLSLEPNSLFPRQAHLSAGLWWLVIGIKTTAVFCCAPRCQPVSRLTSLPPAPGSPHTDSCEQTPGPLAVGLCPQRACMELAIHPRALGSINPNSLRTDCSPSADAADRLQLLQTQKRKVTR